MLGRYQGFALAAAALFSITSPAPHAQAAELIWSVSNGQTDLSWDRRVCLGLCFTNWKRIGLGGFGLVTAGPPQNGDSLTFGLVQGLSVANGGISTNTTTGRDIQQFKFLQDSEEHRINGSRVDLGSGGMLNQSNTEQNFDLTIRLTANQSWDTEGGAFDINGDVQVGDHRLLIRGDGNTNIDGDITGSSTARISKSGDGTLSLDGDNSGFAGEWSISGGRLRLDGGDNISSASTVTISDGTLDLNETDEAIGGLASTSTTAAVDLSGGSSLTVGLNDQDTTYRGRLFGSVGQLVKEGTGTLTLFGENELSRTFVNEGTLEGDAGGGLQGRIFNSSHVIFSSPNGVPNDTFTGEVLGSGDVTFANGGTTTLEGRLSHFGNTRIEQGTRVALGAVNALSFQSEVFIGNGSVLDLNDRNTSIGGLSGSSFSTLELGQGRLQIFSPSGGGTTTFAGSITGGINSSIQKFGDGTLELAGDASFGTLDIFGGGVALVDRIENAPEIVRVRGGEFDLSNRRGNEAIASDIINNSVVRARSTSDVFGTAARTTFSGNVTGAGDFLGNAVFTGTYGPGNSPALVTHQNTTFAASNTLFMEIGGYGRGSEYDAINALSVTLDGLLDIALLDLGNSFSPMSGDTFDLIIADQIFGEFSSFNFAALAEGLYWTTQLISSQAGMIYQLVVNAEVNSSVPAPGAILLVLVGVAGLGALRRRRT